MVKELREGAPVHEVSEDKETESEFFVEVAERSEAKGVRKNQDASYVNAERRFLLVADGMGSGDIGDEVSQELKEQAEDAIDELPDRFDSIEEAQQVVEEFARTLCAETHQMVDDYMHFNENASRPGSTLLIAKIVETPDGLKAVLASVGDSIPYIRRKDGSAERVDIVSDTYMDSKVASGEISVDVAHAIENAESDEMFLDSLEELGLISSSFKSALLQRPLTEDNLTFVSKKKEYTDVQDTLREYITFYHGWKASRAAHSRSLVSSMAGYHNNPEVHMAVVDIEDGDEIHLLTDGLTDPVSDRRIEGVLSGEGSMDQRQGQLFAVVDDVNANKKNLRSKKDDRTIASLRIEFDSESRGGVGADVQEIKKDPILERRLQEAEELVREFKQSDAEVIQLDKEADRISKELHTYNPTGPFELKRGFLPDQISLLDLLELDQRLGQQSNIPESFIRQYQKALSEAGDENVSPGHAIRLIRDSIQGAKLYVRDKFVHRGGSFNSISEWMSHADAYTEKLEDDLTRTENRRNALEIRLDEIEDMARRAEIELVQAKVKSLDYIMVDFSDGEVIEVGGEMGVQQMRIVHRKDNGDFVLEPLDREVEFTFIMTSTEMKEYFEAILEYLKGEMATNEAEGIASAKAEADRLASK